MKAVVSALCFAWTALAGADPEPILPTWGDTNPSMFLAQRGGTRLSGAGAVWYTMRSPLPGSAISVQSRSKKFQLCAVYDIEHYLSCGEELFSLWLICVTFFGKSQNLIKIVPLYYKFE